MHVRCCFIPRLRSSKLGLPDIKQQRLTFVRRFIVVIRLGFEPKTHSLEGCCSIQLSYRTDPFLLLALRGSEVKSGCKDSDYFWICNMACEIFWRWGLGEAQASGVWSPEAEVRSQESGNWRQKSGCFPACDELSGEFDAGDEEEAYEGEDDG